MIRGAAGGTGSAAAASSAASSAASPTAGRKRPRDDDAFRGPSLGRPGAERLCIRGLAPVAAALAPGDVAALFAKVGLAATEVEHAVAKGVSFATVEPLAPSAAVRAGDHELAEEETRALVDRAVRILQGSRWRGALIRSIELCKQEHYRTRLRRTWDEEAQRAADQAAAAQFINHDQLNRMPHGEVLRIKAPYGMGHVWVSTLAGAGDDGDGTPQSRVFASTRRVFYGTDSEPEDAGLEGTYSGTAPAAEAQGDMLSATSSDSEEDEDDEDEDGDREAGEGASAGKAKLPTLRPVKSHVPKAFVEEDWNGTSDEDLDADDEDDSGGLNLLARLKGGGSQKDKAAKKKKKKKKDKKHKHDSAGSAPAAPSVTARAISLAYEEEEWGDADASAGKKAKKPKRTKAKKNSGQHVQIGAGEEEDAAAGNYALPTASASSSSSSSLAKRKRPTEEASSADGAAATEAKKNKSDPAAQNRKRLAALARREKERQRAQALISASLAAAPKSKKISFSSSDEDEDDNENHTDDGKNQAGSSLGGGAKVVMFDSDSNDDDDDDDDDDATSSVGTSAKDGGEASRKQPCPTSDEARFQLKADYEGEAGRHLLKMQRRIGTDTRFQMDKSFLDSDDEGNDDGVAAKEEQVGNDDVTEYEKFEILPKKIPDGAGNEDAEAALNKRANIAQEVNGALDALRSILGEDAKDVRSVHHNKGAGGSSARSKQVTYAKYDPNAHGHDDAEEGGQTQEGYDDKTVGANGPKVKGTGARGDVDDILGRGWGSPSSSSSSSSSGVGVAAAESAARAPAADPSKRFYSSKTNFWTDLYVSTKGRTDVVALKATSAEFRLTDLGLDQKFGLPDPLAGSADAAAAGREDGGGFSVSSLWSSKKEDSGACGGEQEKQKEQEPQQTPAQREMRLLAGLGLSEDVEFATFARKGTEEDAREWWVQNRVALTDAYRQKHRDILRGRRARARAVATKW